jgi:hypothetical protein
MCNVLGCLPSLGVRVANSWPDFSAITPQKFSPVGKKVLHLTFCQLIKRRKLALPMKVKK